MHDYGARKVALFGIGPIGCAPGSVAMYGTNGSICVDHINKAVQLFNTKLKTLVNELNHNLQDSKFIYINAFEIFPITSVEIQDLTGFTAPCCPVANLSTNNGILTCIPLSSSCSNRDVSIFWDGVHPSEFACVILGGRSYAGLHANDTYPIDIQSLVHLSL